MRVSIFIRILTKSLHKNSRNIWMLEPRHFLENIPTIFSPPHKLNPSDRWDVDCRSSFKNSIMRNS